MASCTITGYLVLDYVMKTCGYSYRYVSKKSYSAVCACIYSRSVNPLFCIYTHAILYYVQ